MGPKDDVDELQDKLDEALMNEDMDTFRQLLEDEDEE